MVPKSAETAPLTADFGDAERRLVRTTCAPRWGGLGIGCQPAGVEVAGRWQFFHGDALEQPGTGTAEYDNPGDRVTELLRARADDHSVRSGAFPGAR